MFNGLLSACDVILVLTSVDGTQPSGASEALSLGKPLVISDFEIIRDLFPRGAVYVDNNGKAIAEGIREALSNKDTLSAEMHAYRSEKTRQWREQVGTLANKLDLPDLCKTD